MPRELYITDDDSGEKSVSVLLNGEESELVFIDHSTAEMSVSWVAVPAGTHKHSVGVAKHTKSYKNNNKKRKIVYSVFAAGELSYELRTARLLRNLFVGRSGQFHFSRTNNTVTLDIGKYSTKSCDISRK